MILEEQDVMADDAVRFSRPSQFEPFHNLPYEDSPIPWCFKKVKREMRLPMGRVLAHLTPDQYFV